MKKKDMDELYHNLRLLCVDGSFTERTAIHGLVRHLTNPNGDYAGLVTFLDYYGSSFLLKAAFEAIRSHELKFNRVVDLGCGTGWLGRGLAMAAGDLPTLFVDKRQWTLVDVVADIETANGLPRVMDELREGDLIAMGELVHCLSNPTATLGPILRKYPSVIIEYSPDYGSSFADSYDRQIAAFGCKPVNMIEFLTSTGAGFKVVHQPPHAIVVTSPAWKVE